MTKHGGAVIGVDDTDHVAFFCEVCGSEMEVSDVETVRKVGGTGSSCTLIQLACKKGHTAVRKFYWRRTEPLKGCYFLTTGEVKSPAKKPEAPKAPEEQKEAIK